ncbi:phage portal protein [Kitasatospora sp. NBC_01266]|uniref:phage portal protein n=1 Tax=Kitasatospora sp. NBC_01266 TaxID=2903572 RepID=UPI002E337065|nr:phage portal protein [Kitasatospora sp. NBC_01266]
MSLIRRAAERRTIQQFGDSSIPTNGSLALPSASGVPVNEETALQLSAVWSCVRIISTRVAGLPLAAMRPQGGITVPLPVQPTIVSDPFGGQNDVRWLSRRGGIKQLAVSVLLRGNGFALVTARDWLFRPSRLAVLNPDVVKVDVDDTGARTYQVNRKTVDAVDMLHLTGMSMAGSPVGMSPIAYARQSIGLGVAAQEFGARFFAQGAHLSGVITVDADLDKQGARRIKEGFEASHTGMRNAHAIGVLSGGAKWTPISISPDDAQFLQTKAGQNLDMAMLFGVPPHMLGQVDRTTSWGTGIEQQGLGFLTYTLDDWTGIFEDAWTAMLPRGTSAVFDTAGLLKTDTAGRFAYYVQARTAGVLTQNEARARENLPPVEGGDDINAPLNSAQSGTTGPADPGAPPPPAPDESEEP